MFWFGKQLDPLGYVLLTVTGVLIGGQVQSRGGSIEFMDQMLSGIRMGMKNSSHGDFMCMDALMVTLNF